MAIVFAVRGTSLDAVYSNGGKTGVGMGNTAPASAVDAGALSGSSIQFAANNNLKPVVWTGRSNTHAVGTFSVLLRYRPNYTGTPGSDRPLFALNSGAGRSTAIELKHSVTTGNLTVLIRNELGTAVVNSVSAGAWSPTSGTWYDIVLTWNNTTTANQVKVYVDAVQIGAGITATGVYGATFTNKHFAEIMVGCGANGLGFFNAERIDELVIWDTVIDPTNVTLVSGAGSLNGAARASLVAATAFDGTVSTSGSGGGKAISLTNKGGAVIRV
jgi:hypothetical protein